MATILQTHREHAVLESNIRFYSLEINFLLKILTREYAHMASLEKIKTLDSFWKEFEKYGMKLKKLSDKIKKEEKEISEDCINIDDTTQRTAVEEQLLSEFSSTIDELRLLKESLYDYLESLPS